AVLAHGGCAGARRVGAGLGLRKGPAPEPFARSQARQIAPPLLIVAHFIDMIRAQRSVGRHDNSYRSIDAGKLFNDDRIFDVPQARAPKLLRKDRAQITEIAELADNFARKYLGLVPLE